MTKADAKRVVGFLTAGFHREALEPASVAVWVADLELLPDAEVGANAARQIVRTADRFPTIHQYRQTYRAIAEATRPRQIEPAPRGKELPDWVRVWAWLRARGDGRWLPTQKTFGDSKRGEIGDVEYERLWREWVEAGRPKAALPTGIGR